MKTASFKTVFLATLCLLFLGCKKNTSNDLLVFDVNGNYPVKTLDIEDVADIEYLVLDISDVDYLFSHFLTMTDSFIICRAKPKFLFFSRKTGKPVSKVDRYGNGPGEYNNMISLFPVYSELNNELFFFNSYQIYVYERDGTFKRKFPTVKPSFSLSGLYDFDEEHLLITGSSFRKEDMLDDSFMLISKQDGFVDVIKIPIEERVSLRAEQGGMEVYADTYFAVRNGQDFLLTEYSSDTVYRFTPERELIPVLVRKPSIQKMETKITLHSWLETGQYLFFSTQKIDFDWNTLKWPIAKGYLMEKNTGRFFQTNIQMHDFKGYELILGPSIIDKTSSQQTGIVVWNAWELHEANKENKLNGKLQEVTERLTREDEYVFMILNFK